jgi:hypothetical protein
MESCDCDTTQFPARWFEPEPVNQCSPARRFLDRELGLFPNSLKQSPRHGLVSRACVSFIMHRFGPSSSRSSIFARCASDASAPVRGSYKPCVSSDYVHITTNLLNDLPVCMGINPKFLLPKLAQESGLHWNAFGMGGDAGIGQLTGPAIREVNRYFSFYKNHVMGSNLPSCRRMASIIAPVQPKGAELSRRCGFLWPPQNPALNIFYLTIKLQRDLQYLTEMLDRQGIARRLHQLSGGRLSLHKITELMTLLAYNAGAGGAVSSLQAYLSYRESLMRKGGPRLKPEDFAIRPGERGRPVHPLSFPQYLRIYQRSGTRGYLTKLREQADLLDRALPGNQCTMPDYLRVR